MNDEITARNTQAEQYFLLCAPDSRPISKGDKSSYVKILVFANTLLELSREDLFSTVIITFIRRPYSKYREQK
jgi:hypothetical protein